MMNGIFPKILFGGSRNPCLGLGPLYDAVVNTAAAASRKIIMIVCVQAPGQYRPIHAL